MRSRQQRGIGGGYSLVRPAEDITLLEVVNQVAPIQRIERCPLSLASHGTKLCPLHALLNQVIAAEEKRLSETLVSDVIRKPGELTPLCEVAEILREQNGTGPSATSASPTDQERPA